MATKEECLDLHKKAHVMAFKHMKLVRGVSAERLEKELLLVQDLMADRIYEEHGFESEHVDLMKTRHDLEADDDYQAEFASYMQKIQALGVGGPD